MLSYIIPSNKNRNELAEYTGKQNCNTFQINLKAEKSVYSNNLPNS